jgi:hypothetical protein
MKWRAEFHRSYLRRDCRGTLRSPCTSTTRTYLMKDIPEEVQGRMETPDNRPSEEGPAADTNGQLVATDEREVAVSGSIEDRETRQQVEAMISEGCLNVQDY